jgi:hypothetical protein
VRVALVSYFDSSCIAKFYLDEPESEAVRRLAESLGQVRCAVIGQIEVAAVFHRKFRESPFDARAFREVMAQFDDDRGQGVWTWLTLTTTLAARTTAVFARLPRPGGRDYCASAPPSITSSLPVTYDESSDAR